MFDNSTLYNLARLDYSELWLDYGVLTEINLAKQIQELDTGEDTNKEHYRYKTLRHFLDNKLFLDNIALRHIVEILKADQDKAMSSSATIYLLKKNYLTNDQFDLVTVFLKTFGDWTEKQIDKIKNDRRI